MKPLLSHLGLTPTATADLGTLEPTETPLVADSETSEGIHESRQEAAALLGQEQPHVVMGATAHHPRTPMIEAAPGVLIPDPTMC